MANMTQEEAKALYFKYNCNSFGLFREEGSAFEEFKDRCLTKKEIDKWREEWFTLKYKELAEKKDPQLFSVLADNMIISKTNLKLMNEVIDSLIYTSEEDKEVIIGDLLGRKKYSLRSGLIFTSYDSGERELAINFSSVCKELLKMKSSNSEIEEMFSKNRLRLQKTMADLNIMN